ncbi:type I-F CRISPR-associated protein Csy2, partial [Luteolibacter algae]
MSHPNAILILPRIRVQNANALTSPFTWGFPGPPAFGGFVHALSRKLSAAHPGVSLGAFAVLSHAFNAQASGVYESNFHLSRNPLKADGKLPSTIEEARAHLTISLVISLHSSGVLEDREAVTQAIARLLPTMRLAGGSIIPTEGRFGTSRFPKPILNNLSKDSTQVQTDTREILSRVRGGFALVSATGRLAAHHREMKVTQPETTALLALTDICARTRILVSDIPPGEDDSPGQPASWEILRRPGWLVPIASGYRAISS